MQHWQNQKKFPGKKADEGIRKIRWQKLTSFLVLLCVYYMILHSDYMLLEGPKNIQYCSEIIDD